MLFSWVDLLEMILGAVASIASFSQADDLSLLARRDFATALQEHSVPLVLGALSN